MFPSTHADREANGAGLTSNAVLIREQLNRLLSHPLFTHSKRYPVLLTFTVERALLGHVSDLRERTIGVEAFGRAPNYDVGLDPIVRTTAAEVRKRLIQYYYDAAHAGELVIELSVGSYVPTFKEAQTATVVAPAKVELVPPVPIATASDSSEEESVSAQASTSRARALRALLAVATLAIFGLSGFFLGRARLVSQPTNLQRFWSPITGANVQVTYCLGEPRSAADQSTADPLAAYGSLNVSDVTTLARSIGPLVAQKGIFRVVAASHTSFDQLREGPVVLIGAFDNAWTLRITNDLPIGFESNGNLRSVVDRGSPRRQVWSIDSQLPDNHLDRDYALVARIHDKTTGEPVIILAGIWAEGTESASEAATNPVYLDSLLASAPKDWEQKNLEAVIETQLIQGHAGPPHILAVRTW